MKQERSASKIQGGSHRHEAEKPSTMTSVVQDLVYTVPAEFMKKVGGNQTGRKDGMARVESGGGGGNGGDTRISET